MKDTVTFEIFKNNGENLDELIKLAKTYYSDSDIINKKYLNWQYYNNPAGKPFLFTSKEIKTQELAGQYLVIPIEFNVFNKKYTGTLSLNTLTSPKYQGKGLFTKMAKATYEDCEDKNAMFTIGFPNPNSYPGFVKKLNFSHLGDIPLMIKPLKHLKLVKSYFKKNKVKHGYVIKLNTIDDNQIKEFDFEYDEEKYNLFWEMIETQYSICTNKNFSFLKWRYKDIPTRDYKIYYHETHNKINGIIIVKASQVWGFNVGVIMDFMVLNNSKETGKQLLNYVKRISKNSNLDFITCLHSKSNEYYLLKQLGFYSLPQILLPQKIHFIVRINKDFNNSEKLLNLNNNWKLSFGDYDVF